MSALIIQSGKHKGKKLRLPKKDVIVGRDEGCTIRLQTKDISRKHCSLRVTSEGIFVQDLGSQNGTFVNDVQIQDEIRLEPGDLLRVGPVMFQVAGQKSKVEETAEKASAKTAEKSELASDDEIESWLADDDDSGPVSAGETTIISRSEARKASAETEANVSNQVTAQQQNPKKKFKSVAEEGADIIRRHKEKE